MPELPEVETTRRLLVHHVVGARIVDVEVGHPRMVRYHEQSFDFARRLRGSRITGLGRQGKYLKADLDNDIIWVTHLGMSGRVEIGSRDQPASPHANVRVVFDTGDEFRLVDPRTFGFVVGYTPEELLESPLSRLGPDALTDLPSSRQLSELLAGRRAPIKPLLLDQTVIAGLGNIYADESLHRARILPFRPAGSLRSEEIVKLRRSVVVTLDLALRHGGTSLSDLAYLLPDGRAGDFTARLAVYGRDGAPCRRCGAEIQHTVLRQRSTHWCPQCQD